MIRLLVVGILLFFTHSQDEAVTIFLVADSTVADKPYSEGNPEKGWGQVFPLYFDEGVKIENHAVNGRSTKSFMDEGRWKTVVENITPGDFVFIEFGHNDSKKSDPARYADPDTAYRVNLQRYIQDTRDRGGIPVLCTPIVRRKFNAEGTLIETHGKYPAVMREVAIEEDVVLIDLHKLTVDLLEAYGEESSKSLFLHIAPGEYATLPEGLKDDTHLSANGAFRVCDLVVSEIKKKIPSLAGHLKK